MGMLLDVTLDKRIPIVLLRVFMQLEDLLSRIHPADHFKRVPKRRAYQTCQKWTMFNTAVQLVNLAYKPVKC
jgi:hypothetical protein